MHGDDIHALAAPLGDAGDFDPLLDRIGDARVVMLGEASHGTHDFYRWRAELTRRLIDEHGFSFVAVEGDWPDCDRIDRAVRCRPGGGDPRDALKAFDRWPTWMWANEEVSDFVIWLRDWNLRHAMADLCPTTPPEPFSGTTAPEPFSTTALEPARDEAGVPARGRRDLSVVSRPRARLSASPPGRAVHPVGFHGLDVYSLWESLAEILGYLREHDPDGVPAALAALRCLDPYARDPQRYAFATVMGSTCAPALVELLMTVRQRATAGDSSAAGDVVAAADPFRAFAARQNAEAAVGAENYYREMVGNGPDSWNVRDIHMVNTLERLLQYYGPSSKAIVWAHNTHIGDARATDMADAGMVNLGQLGRERWGADAVALVGFGCHRGEVLAGPAWGDLVEVMPVPPARAGSLEAVLQATLPEPALFVFPPGVYASGHTGARPAWIADVLPHRAIGVVYRPSRESYGNYVPTRLGDRYDAFVWLPETTALRPLEATPVGGELQTFPAGV
ncbi:erythromycin esterase family protein [Cryptosporangium minutisporangium]|uniref:Erythromycin esterase n=1 Tax=Cryptosporangium minutisporangium TaxID=113569 RepID=A0ABP6SSK0_9ACTN